jgi:enoyl-CoA hydratase/carnithine racemase
MNDIVAPLIIRERDGQVARVIVGSGLRRNALTSGAWAGIERAVRELATDAALRVMVLEGAAEWFCAGSDITEWAKTSNERVELSFARMEAACTAIEDLPIPVIAKVRGPAAGAGCQLALACDLRIFDARASIGMPIARLGILISPSFAHRVAVNAGPSVAGDLVYSGRMVGAVEAVELGLANACIPSDDVDRYVEVAIDSILRSSDASIRAGKRALAQLAAPARAAARALAGPATDEADFRRRVRTFTSRRRRGWIRVPQ